MSTHPHRQDILILGAGYAGMAAALRLARTARHLPVTITLINASPVFTERVRLHQVAAATAIRERPIRDLLRGTTVQFVHGRVVALEPEAHTVTVQTEIGTQTRRYDYLIYALGSIPDRDAVPGVREHTCVVGDPATAAGIAVRLSALGSSGGRVAIVGGGLTGIETAAEIAEAYPSLRVQLISAGAIGRGLSARGVDHVRRTLTRLGVTLSENVPIARVTADALYPETGGSGRDPIPFDVCIWAGPFRALPLAQEAGWMVNERGQIGIDRAMRVRSHPDVYAAGDSAAFSDDIGVPIRMACATAIPMGVHAADNVRRRITGEAEQPFAFRYLLQCISLGRRDGLIQFVRADDAPRDGVITGRLAAWIKESVVQYARLSAATRPGAGYYVWPKAGRRAVGDQRVAPVRRPTEHAG